MIRNVWAVYFSPTGSTRGLTVRIAKAAAEALGAAAVQEFDITKPENRQSRAEFGARDFVIFGMPTYAGRLPNKIMPYIRDSVKSAGASCVPVVTFGGRSFDDSLAELSDLLEETGFKLAGGGAFVCRHAFAKVAEGRPGRADFEKAAELGEGAMKNLQTGHTLSAEVFPGNHPAGPYSVPKGLEGTPAVFLKAKPVTDSGKCTGCSLCAEHCPMGSIGTDGICIKCQACIAVCPQSAKYFTDGAFLSHKAMLERDFADNRVESQIWI